MKIRIHPRYLSAALAAVMLCTAAGAGAVMAQPASSNVAVQSGDESTEPTPTSPPVQGGDVFVSGYELLNQNGKVGNLVRDKNNDTIPSGTLTVYITDQRINGSHLGANDFGKVQVMPQQTSVFTAEQGTVSQISAVPGSDTVAGHVTYKVVFNNLKYYGGDNNFSFDISYTGLNGNMSVPVQTLSLALPQCQTIEKAGAQSGVELRAPGLLVKDFSYGGASVPAGEEFTLNLTVFTTTGDQALSDVTVNLGLPEGVTMSTGNSSQYVGAMNPETSANLQYKILPGANFTGGVATFQVTMSGVGSKDGAKSEATSTITVPVVQPERFEITKISGAETLMVGEEGYLEVTFVNKGKQPVSNLSAEISGENLRNPGQSQYLGNVQPGTENTAEFTISSDVEGTITGMITLSYEDANGNVKTISKEYSCTVQPAMDMGGMDPGMEMPIDPMPEEKSGLPVWAWILIGLGVVGVGAAVTVVVLKKKKAKALAMLEDDDEDI